MFFVVIVITATVLVYSSVDPRLSLRSCKRHAIHIRQLIQEEFSFTITKKVSRLYFLTVYRYYQIVYFFNTSSHPLLILQHSDHILRVANWKSVLTSVETCHPMPTKELDPFPSLFIAYLKMLWIPLHCDKKPTNHNLWRKRHE